MDSEQIIFFDGVCNLCNGFVDFVVRHDPDGKFKFAPLQGSTAAAKLPAEVRSALRSVILLKDGQFYYESQAALLVIKDLGRHYAFAAQLGLLLPPILSNAVYNLVAKNRYRIFGKRDSCRLPTLAERDRFLD